MWNDIQVVQAAILTIFVLSAALVFCTVCVSVLVHVCLTWVEDGAGAAPCHPGLRVKGGPTFLDLHLGALAEHLLNFDLHLGVRALIVCRQHSHL